VKVLETRKQGRNERIDNSCESTVTPPRILQGPCGCGGEIDSLTVVEAPMALLALQETLKVE
jgi:hypothetical protein